MTRPVIIPSAIRILGFDPGYGRLGYGVVEVEGEQIRALASGVVTTEKDKPIAQRLAEISRDVRSLLAEFKPHEVAVEEFFFVQNVTNGIAVAMSRGVILSACDRIPVSGYAPMTIKQAVTGYGKADKHQVTAAVMELLGLAEKPTPDDAADGLAIALCHWMRRGQDEIGSPAPMQPRQDRKAKKTVKA